MRPPKKANARRQPSERARLTNYVPSLARGTRGIKLISSQWRAFASGTTPAGTKDDETYGTPELCAWHVAPGVFWIQTTEPFFSRKLEKREDTRRVELIGVNHFRRTFEMRGTWRKIRRIIDRYLLSANSGFFEPKRPRSRRNLQTGSLQRDIANEPK
jgi:hypothetical protein